MANPKPRIISSTLIQLLQKLDESIVKAEEILMKMPNSKEVKASYPDTDWSVSFTDIGVSVEVDGVVTLVRRLPIAHRIEASALIPDLIKAAREAEEHTVHECRVVINSIEQVIEEMVHTPTGSHD